MKYSILTLALILGSQSSFSAAIYPLQPTKEVKEEALKQVLLSSIVDYMKPQKRSSYFDGTESSYLSLLSYYKATPADVEGAIAIDSELTVTTKNTQGQALPIFEGKTYQSLSNSMVDLSANVSTKPIEGWNAPGIKTAGDLIEFCLRTFAYNASEGLIFKNIDLAYVTEDGLNLYEMVEKTLFGAMSLAQASQNLLQAKSTEDWDKAYLAFGASSDLLNYTDLETKGKGSLDTNKDGFISLVTEKNYAMAVYAANADSSAKDGLVDFTTSIVSSFIQGRELFDTNPALSRQFAQSIIKEWEKVLAAKAVGYLNKAIANLELAGTASFDHTKTAGTWSEGKGFALAIQYSPIRTMTEQDFAQVHQLLKDRPVLPSAGLQAVKNYKQDLLKVRKIFQDTYQFSETNVNNW